MHANHIISPELLANDNRFTDPFFQRFRLRHRATPLALSATVQKDYLFPTFYGNVSCAQAIFLCNYERAQALLPHPKMKPVRMPGGRAALVLASYIYRNVMHIAPYNEIAMTIPVRLDPVANVPLLPLLTPWFKNFGYYVFNMPVTSKENRIRGNAIWGLPKVLHDIDIRIQDGLCETTAIDEAGEEYLRLRVPTLGTATAFDTRAQLYSRLDQQLLQSSTYFKATFHINKHLAALRRKPPTPTMPYLTLGQGRYAEQLRALEIEPLPLQLRFADHMNACFDLANTEFQTPFTFHDTPVEALHHG